MITTLAGVSLKVWREIAETVGTKKER